MHYYYAATAFPVTQYAIPDVQVLHRIKVLCLGVFDPWKINQRLQDHPHGALIFAVNHPTHI